MAVTNQELDNLVESCIMTSEERGHHADISRKQDNPARISTERGDLKREINYLSQREQAETPQTAYERPGTGRVRSNQSTDVQEASRKSDAVRGMGDRSLESGDKGSDFGDAERLIPGAIETSLPRDIILRTPEDVGANMGAAARFDANLAAIKTLKKIESEARRATPEEQAILAKYSGFGDSQFNPAFEHYWGRDYESWKKRGDELKAITTPEEYKSIASSRLNAFYTTPEVIKAMWMGLERLGIDNLSSPHILEPSAGSGRFLGYQPIELAARSQRTAVELDKLTGRILKQLYPQSEIHITGFEEAPLPKESFDIAISNVPFGNYKVFDPSFKKRRAKLTNQIHNYFFAKTLERLRPGGVLAFITTHGTLDAESTKPQRELMAEEADFLGAIRLPRKTFGDTEVCTDIIYMRKRSPGDPPGDKSWIDTVEIELQGEYQKVHKPVNKYFIEHPEMVLGKHSARGSMRASDEYTVEPVNDGRTISDKLHEAIQRLPKNVIKNMPPIAPRSVAVDSAVNFKENSYVVDKDGTLRIKQHGELTKANLNTQEAERVKKMLKIRDAAKKVLDLQLNDATDSEITEAQKELDRIYKDFTGNYGALRNKDNANLMKLDPDGPFLLALEKNAPHNKQDRQSYDAIIKAKKLTPDEADKLKMGIFKGRTVKGLGFTTIKDETDALAFVLNETGRLDFERMGSLLGKKPEDIIRTLEKRGDIFKNPIGDYELASIYLSGDVREKLRTAILAAEANPRYRPNVEALKKVQPADLKPSEIGVSLGAPWIPEKYVNEFVREITNASSYSGKTHYFTYVPQTGKWVKVDKLAATEDMLTSKWGTKSMPADEIIEHLLNGKLVEIKEKKEGADGKLHEVRNEKLTIAAQEKAEQIEREFRDWLWRDGDRAGELVRIYNDTFNGRRPRYYDGSHLIMPGMSEKWAKQLHPHQKDAIWRVVQDRTVLLAHEVGFGKTAVMVAAGKKLRDLGLSRKNLYVVPKATFSQFQEQFADIYPYANVLAPTPEDFTPAKRAEFVSRVATSDWDAVILTNEQFEKLPLKPETQARFLEDELEAYRAALAAIKQEKEASEDEQHGYWYYRRRSKDPVKERTQKQIETAIKNKEAKLKELLAQSREKSDKTIYFEDLGIDQLFVDEADMYKKLEFATQMSRIKGLPQGGSKRAWDMYQKVRYLQEQGKGHGVVFATGTPISNTIAEMYTMMRYLQEPLLESKGLQHFDAWAKTFGETTETLEQTPTGKYAMSQRFAKFQNAPELSQLWQETADIRVADEVPGMVKLRPRLVDDNGKPRRTVIAIKPDDALLEYMKECVRRAERMGEVDKHEDNMLKLSNDARKAALDVRMVNPNAPGNPNGKIAVLAKNVSRIYKETTPDKGTQLVFLDLGTPKTKDTAEAKDNNEAVKMDDEAEISDYETEEEKKLLEDVYSSIRDALVENGIPKNEIAFIHDAKNDKQKMEMQSKVKAGDIRVIIGSTGKLGTGTNIQDRAAALHHLDVPWRPRDIEQREGRILRQGNIVYGPKFDAKGNIIDPGKGVRIYTYVTEKSFDGYMWQAVEAKSKAIKSVMRRENPPRAIEDCDSFTMSAAEAKAVASGNPDVLKQVALKNSVARLQMVKASYLDGQVRAKEQLKKLPGIIQELDSAIDKMGKDVIKTKKEGVFEITVKGRTYKDKERPDGAKALLDAIIASPVVTDVNKKDKIGAYKGFDIDVVNMGASAGVMINVKSPDTGMEYLVSSSIPYNELSTGVLTRIENTVKRIESDLEKAKQELAKNQASLRGYEKLAKEEFEYEDKLKAMEKELDRISRKLQGEKIDDEGPSDNYIPEEELPEITPAYKYGEHEEEQQAVTVNPEAEIQAVQETIAHVENALEVKEPTHAELNKIEKAVENMAKPAKEIPPTEDIARKDEADMPHDEKHLWEMTSAEFNKKYPVLKDLTESEQKEILEKLNKHNKEYTGVDEDIPYDVFIKDFGDMRFDKDEATLVEHDHKYYIVEAVKNKYGIPANVQEEYKELIAEIKAKIQENRLKRAHKKDKVIKSKSRKATPEKKPAIKKVKRVKVEKKPKVERRVQKPPIQVKAGEGATLGIRALKQVHQSRSLRAQVMDEARQNKRVLQPKDPRVETWIKKPSSYDISGIDTEGQKKIIVVGGKLTNKEREALPDNVFALPERRAYPIHDLAHARVALARVAQHGTPDEKYRVRNTIYATYPQLIKIQDIGKYLEPVARTAWRTGKQEVLDFIKEENSKGRKVEIEYKGRKDGKPEYVCQSYDIKPYMQKYKVETNKQQVKTPWGMVELKESAEQIKAKEKKWKPSPSGVSGYRQPRIIDLGAGVVREGRRQHIKI